MEDHSPEEDILALHLPSIAEEDEDDAEEHFLTVSLDDNVWMEEPVQRGTYASMKTHNMICTLTPAHTVCIHYTSLKKMAHST